MIRRREVLTLLGAAGAAWPAGAWAQQGERVRRVGILLPVTDSDAEGQQRVSAFVRALQQLGWGLGKNVRIDYRLSGNKVETMRASAAELVTLGPDVILALSSAATAPLLEATRTIPIVFTGVADPVATGYVESLSRPGGNATGFTVYESSIGKNWLQLLKEIAPRVKRVALLRETVIGADLFATVQTLAPSMGLEMHAVDVRDAGETKRALTTFAQTPNGGVIATGGPRQSAQRHLIAGLAKRHGLPAIYNARFFVTAGGLISYGADFVDQAQLAAGYVDRILKGEKPAELPVQVPTKYDLAINLKTARALGLTVPRTLLARADEVIK